MPTVPTYARDGSVHVIVESPRGSTAKYENGVVFLHRALPAGFAYPFDWGFVPGTLAADGDPLDAMVLWSGSSHPGVVIPVRPIGILKIEQASRGSGQRERNDRLLAVPVSDPTQTLTDVFSLPGRTRDELQHFFEAVVAFEHKAIAVLGWGDASDAAAAVAQAAAARDERDDRALGFEEGESD
ncbi:MAG: inorganic diphosphatase [Vicinamibacterales bacterium]